MSTVSLNSRQNVHYIDIDLCTPTSFLPCCCLFSSSACPQTDTAQWNNTQFDSVCTHIWIEQALSQSCSQKQVQSYCHLEVIHGSGAGSLKPLICEDATTSTMTEPLDAELLKNQRDLGKPPSFDGNDAEYHDFRFSFRIHTSLVSTVSQPLMDKSEIERNPISLTAVKLLGDAHLKWLHTDVLFVGPR